MLEGERRLFITEGKRRHARIVTVSGRFFSSLAAYLDLERPRACSERVFLVVKGARRGEPLSTAGLDEIIQGARGRAGIERLSCHQLLQL